MTDPEKAKRLTDYVAEQVSRIYGNATPPDMGKAAIEGFLAPKMREVIEADIIDGIVNTATEIVDKYGEGQSLDILGGEPKFKSGYFIVRDNEAKGLGSRIPSLSVNIPVGDFVEQAAWKAELTFGFQHGGLSTHVLVNKDNSIMLSYYDGRPEEFMTGAAARAFGDKLAVTATQIGEDHIDHFAELPVTDQPHE